MSPFSKDKKVIWIHAASVGEINSVFPLVDKLIKMMKVYLFYSLTLSSSQLIKKKNFDKEF